MPRKAVVGGHLNTPMTPPPLSVAFPVTVSRVLCGTCVPSAGDVMIEAGGVVSVDAVAATRLA